MITQMGESTHPHGTGTAGAVLLAGMAAAVMLAGCLGDECTEGASRCDGNEVQSCISFHSDGAGRNLWVGADVCGNDATTCIAPPGQHAMCVESTELDPACGGGANSYCSGDAVAGCSGGYRTRTKACGATDSAGRPLLRGGLGATHCIEPQPGATTCVPAGAAADPLCADRSGSYCDGNELVECTSGLLVSRTACAACAVIAGPSAGNDPNPCAGYLGAGCQDDGACAPGLSCLPDSRGLLRCTAACQDVMSTPDQAIPTPAPTCLALFRDGGPPPSGVVASFVPGNVLACVSGNCEWLVR